MNPVNSVSFDSRCLFRQCSILEQQHVIRFSRSSSGILGMPTHSHAEAAAGAVAVAVLARTMASCARLVQPTDCLRSSTSKAAGAKALTKGNRSPQYRNSAPRRWWRWTIQGCQTP